jgi:hypothetical protein
MVFQQGSRKTGDRKRRGFRRYRAYLAPPEVIDIARTRCVLEKQPVDLQRFIELTHRTMQQYSLFSTCLESEYHGTYRNSREIRAEIQAESGSDQTGCLNQYLEFSSWGDDT